MLEGVYEGDGIARARVYAKAAEGAKAHVVLPLIEYLLLLSVFLLLLLRNDFDRAVRAVHFADGTCGTSVLVVLVVSKDKLTLKTAWDY